MNAHTYIQPDKKCSRQMIISWVEIPVLAVSMEEATGLRLLTALMVVIPLAALVEEVVVQLMFVSTVLMCQIASWLQGEGEVEGFPALVVMLGTFPVILVLRVSARTYPVQAPLIWLVALEV